MTTIKPAKEAYSDTRAQLAEAQKTIISKAIDAACAKGLYKCFCKMSPEVATYLRGLGYICDEQTNFGKVQGYQISWEDREGVEPSEPTDPEKPTDPVDPGVDTDTDGDVVLKDIEVISYEDEDLTIGVVEKK